MLHRFFTSLSLATNDITLTDESQVHQITRVLRLVAGDTFILNEGNGEDVTVTISHLHAVGRSSSMQLQVVSRTAVWVPHTDVHLCLATLRKERFEWALEKCTELGVAKISPLTTERSERGSVSRVRAERILKEASEQSGRGDIPEYGEVEEVERAISTAVNGGKTVFACVHNGAPFSSVLTNSLPYQLTTMLVLIGPEGGWSPSERALFKKNTVTEVSLGATNLRAETAAVTACALAHTKHN
jgi:16S rRNA (uracil1498-N3)-methyltransferase